MNDYPEKQALKTWTVGEVTFSILDCRGVHFCGYARFPEKPVKEDGYHGILTYVPVHGGITYAEQEDGGIVYGFDCGHAGDTERPELRDMEWLGEECHKMAEAIKIAAEFEDSFLASEGNNEARAEVLSAYHEAVKERIGKEFNLQNNFGAMINLLGGRL